MLPPGRCQRCAFSEPCLCARIPRVETKLRVEIIRHCAEQWKTTNSVRWASIALPNSRVYEYGRLQERFDEADLGDTSDAWLLFPSPDAPVKPAKPPARIIVPDGTWQQARRVVSRLPSLRTLPRLSLPAPERIRLRRPFFPHAQSTLEAIAAALEFFDEPAAAARLMDVYQLALDVIVERRGSPLPG